MLKIQLTMEKREVERKFLLRRFPDPHQAVFDSHLYIVQRYTAEGVRYRQSIAYSPSTGEWEFTRTTKPRVDAFECIETEETLTMEEYNAAHPTWVKGLTKHRFVLNRGKLQFVVDHISQGPILLEVEYMGDDPQEAQDFKSAQIEFPDFLKEDVFMEITGQVMFLNCNLARTIPKGNPVQE